MGKLVPALSCAVVCALAALLGAPANAAGLAAAFQGDLLGPSRASGVVVWSHGRSMTVEDSKSPTPPFLRELRASGWDVLRFDRLRDADTLSASTRLLTDHVAELKRQGYRRIVLAGQSFGAFLALMAADASSDVDAVVATAPAAFGSFDEFYDSWRLNATRLYPLLDRVQRARVMLFFFHDDDFDPGGRGDRSRAILAGRGLGFAVVDQPAYLVGHWAASTGLFLRRFGGCIRDFVDADGLKGELACAPAWGEKPSAELRLPAELLRPREIAPAASPAVGASAPSAPATPPTAAPTRDSWYGFYPNGREVLIAVDEVHGDDVAAVYAIGPGIDKGEPAEWTRRNGRIDGDELIFSEKGKSTLHCRPRGNGGLSLTWVSSDGKSSMEAGLRPVDLTHLPRRTAAR
jgi:pimeloyl-ACP methyl ester carboxylesterase